jgi:hypothetical protein
MTEGICQCIIHKGKNRRYHLQDHHLAEKSKYPEYANDPENILPVCYDCHHYLLHDNGNLKKLSRYGKKLRSDYLKMKGIEEQEEQEKEETTFKVTLIFFFMLWAILICVGLTTSLKMIFSWVDIVVGTLVISIIFTIEFYRGYSNRSE